MTLTFGKFHCSTFPENIDGIITITNDRSFFIICQTGSNDNPHNELELKLRHFNRGVNKEQVYTTSNEAVTIDLWDVNESNTMTSFGFYIVHEGTERRGFKIRALPYDFSRYDTYSINDTISLDIITFLSHDDLTSTEVYYSFE